VIPQLKFIIPLNPPDGLNTNLKLALCPALTVCEVGEPDTGPIRKSWETPDRAMVCGFPGAVSLIIRLAARGPPALGVNVTETLQLPPIAKEPGQLFVWLKSVLFVPVTLMAVMLRAALPVFTRVTAAGGLVLPTVSVARLTRLVDKVRSGPFTPVPVKEIAKGLLRVLSVRLTAPD
jgi:hypothetical protein